MSAEPAYGHCAECGDSLSDGEMFRGEVCSECAGADAPCIDCGLRTWLNARGECVACQRSGAGPTTSGTAGV